MSEIDDRREDAVCQFELALQVRATGTTGQSLTGACHPSSPITQHIPSERRRSRNIADFLMAQISAPRTKTNRKMRRLTAAANYRRVRDTRLVRPSQNALEVGDRGVTQPSVTSKLSTDWEN
jgi:hypothetical protein